jgi:hypothetical protein
VRNGSISGAAFISTPGKWIHPRVTTQRNVSAIVGKCGARTKAFEGPLRQGRYADVRCVATIPGELRVSIVAREVEAEMKRPYPGIAMFMFWAVNNYTKRRSEQALLWEGVTLLDVGAAGGCAYIPRGDDPR